MTARCKFVLHEIHSHHGYTGQTFVFAAVSDAAIPEDQAFTRATPSGKLEVLIANPTVQQALKLGSAYYLDISEAPGPGAAAS